MKFSAVLLMLVAACVADNVFIAECDLSGDETDIVGGNLAGLAFCSEWNGERTSKELTGEYASDIDAAVKFAYDSVIAFVKAKAAQHNFTFCDACFDRLRALLCGGAFPPPGIVDCVRSIGLQAIDSNCPDLCPPCDGSRCCGKPEVSQNSTGCSGTAKLDASQAASNQTVGDAVNACTAAIGTTANLKNLRDSIKEQCAKKISPFSGKALYPARSICEDYVNTCLCNGNVSQSLLDEACSVFPVNGYPLPASLTVDQAACTWCSPVTNRKRGAAAGPGDLVINDNLVLREDAIDPPVGDSFSVDGTNSPTLEPPTGTALATQVNEDTPLPGTTNPTTPGGNSTDTTAGPRDAGQQMVVSIAMLVASAAVAFFF